MPKVHSRNKGMSCEQCFKLEKAEMEREQPRTSSVTVSFLLKHGLNRASISLNQSGRPQSHFFLVRGRLTV